MIKRNKLVKYLLKNEGLLIDLIEEINIIDNDFLLSLDNEIESMDDSDKIQVYYDFIENIVNFLIENKDDIENNDNILLELLYM